MAGAGVATIALATPVAALTSRYEDAGYSRDVESRTVITACDTKADGNGVYANWWQTGRSNYDTLSENQGNGNCNAAAALNDRLVRAHIIWINLSGRPDPHGPYVSY
jgi:hypothetical protein